MKPNNTHALFLAVTVLIVSQLACQTLFPLPSTPTAVMAATPNATATAVPIIPTSTIEPGETLDFTDDEIKAGIQQSLNTYAEALTDNRPELLQQVVDQENKPFRRIVSSRFNDFQESYMSGQVHFEFTVLDITRREYGFVVARFSAGTAEAAWPFRYVDGAWRLSEPSPDQVGEPTITETDHFRVTAYAWSEDYNPLIIEMLETARLEVEEVLGSVPDEKPTVEIMPIYGLRQFESMQAVASYSKGASPSSDRILIYAPNSFVYSFYDAERSWQAELQDVLTHEYTHLTHARSFDGAGKLADWMSEGLAEYVAGQTENSRIACDAMEAGTLIPILDETRDYGKQDLMHMYSLTENFGLSYDFAMSLVEFTVAEYGGLDGFWRLARELDDKGDLKKAVQNTFGVTFEEYNAQWLAWLRKKC